MMRDYFIGLWLLAKRWRIPAILAVAGWLIIGLLLWMFWTVLAQ